MIGPLFDMFTGAMFIFSSVKFRNMCKPRTGWPTSIGILWKWASKPTELAGDSECRLTRFHQIRNFLANEIYHFSRPSHQTGLSFNQSSLLHIISSLFSHFCLFQTAILHKMLKLGFWNFKPIFLRMQFSLVATFFLYFWLSVWVEICILNFLMSFQHLYHLTFGDKSARVLDFHIWN